MSFELLAEERQNLENDGIHAIHWSWQAEAAHLRRGISKPEDLTQCRSDFIKKAIDADKQGHGPARSLPCPMKELEAARLRQPPIDVALLPPFSAAFTLRFKLLSPLLTRDDDPFYLFDNPVRKDHIFGVPHLAAASLKGFAADAFQRGFPSDMPWAQLGDKEQERKTTYRKDCEQAKRLFGIASDDNETFKSEAGRLHFAPVWFTHVQYLVMNPTERDGSGVGTQPIQFEAIAPVDERGKPVEAEVSLFYFNPAGAAHTDEATARADLAGFLGALAAWWPALGLGAKRLAGYGAIAPVSAQCQGAGFPDMQQPLKFSGPKSWMELAQRIAKGTA